MSTALLSVSSDAGSVDRGAHLPELDHLLLLGGSDPVPLGFVRTDDSIFLIANDRAARWPVDLLRRGVADLAIGPSRLEGTVALVVDREERDRTLAAFEGKYGPVAFRRWYAAPARMIRISTGPPGEATATDGRYLGWLEQEFDNVAEDYDRHITGNRINRLLRDRSLATLRPLFARTRRLLEVGCGSGMETLPLLEEGHEIVAVDLSERMLSVVREKARRRGLTERLTTLHASAGTLERHVRELGAGSVGGAYSTYGAMNCEPDLAAVARGIHSLLEPHGTFLAGVYNRYCAAEWAGYGLTGRWSRATGRLQRPVEVGASRFCVDVYSHSTVGFARELGPWFRPVRWEAVPLVLPPSDLHGYAEKFAARFDLLARADARLSRWPVLRSLGDHFLMVLRRIDRAEPASMPGTGPTGS